MARPDLVHSWVSDSIGGYEPDFVWHELAQIWQTPGDGERHLEELFAGDADARAARMVEWGIPEPAAGEVRVRVEGCGVCGSSLPLWQGREWFSYPLEPGAPGHEVWGRLEDGRRVAALSYHGFAEWDLAREDQIVELPPELDSLPFPGEALACAVNVVRRSGVEPGARVAVVGMGFLGTAVARLLGDVTEVRRGAEGAGEFDVVIEAAGTEQAWFDAEELVRPGGTVVMFGGLTRDARPPVDAFRLHYEELTIRGSFHHTPADVRAALAFLASGAHPWERLVTHRIPLDGLPRLLADPPRDLLKAAVYP
jgi:threonine dehydrogenase-like Zn-dependent dehydrogenase